MIFFSTLYGVLLSPMMVTSRLAISVCCAARRAAVVLRHQRGLERREKRTLVGDDIAQRADQIAVHVHRVLGDHDDHGGARLAVGQRLRNRNVLGVRQDVHFRGVREQEHHQDGHHVDERNQREMIRAVPALPMPLDAIGRHVGASPMAMSGNSSALENGATGSW